MKRGGKKNENGGEKKVERKDQEKKRREYMKKLCHDLSSLIPRQHLPNSPKDLMTQQNILDEAASHIMNLKQRIEKLKDKRNSKQTSNNNNMNKLPIIEVRISEDTNLEVILVISSLYKKLKFHEVIGIVEEEGGEVINANMSSINDKVFYTIHSQAFSSRIGFEASKVLHRLRDLVS